MKIGDFNQSFCQRDADRVDLGQTALKNLSCIKTDAAGFVSRMPIAQVRPVGMKRQQDPAGEKDRSYDLIDSESHCVGDHTALYQIIPAERFVKK